MSTIGNHLDDELRASVPQEVSSDSPIASRRPSCADAPGNWDLDIGTPDIWRAAVEVCASCPLLGECRELVTALLERGEGPRAMIWAGVGYDSQGKVIENLDRHRTGVGDLQRPLRIIRTGPLVPQQESVVPVPRRRLVLGRRLRPTGTECG
ncbi:hypothetical protein [Nocardia sp. NPDC051832]|uniref:hypothetical protein n=1 Tax=Nocardia sp. NPDC051832 TaxID=3155673 RepID=UPI00342A92EB